jgi:hypothetical protein
MQGMPVLESALFSDFLFLSGIFLFFPFVGLSCIPISISYPGPGSSPHSFITLSTLGGVG